MVNQLLRILHQLLHSNSQRSCVALISVPAQPGARGRRHQEACGCNAQVTPPQRPGQ